MVALCRYPSYTEIVTDADEKSFPLAFGTDPHSANMFNSGSRGTRNLKRKKYPVCLNVIRGRGDVFGDWKLIPWVGQIIGCSNLYGGWGGHGPEGYVPGVLFRTREGGGLVEPCAIK